MERNNLLGPSFAAGATIALGSSVAVSRLIVDYPHLGGQAIRYLLGALTLALLLRMRRQSHPHIDRTMFVRLLMLALSGLVGFNLLLLAALRYTDPAALGTVVGAVPIVLALLGPILEGSTPHKRTLLSACVVVLGAGIAQGGGDTSLLGFVLALGTLACEAAFSLLALPLLPRLGPLMLSTYLCFIASITLGICAVAVDGSGAFPRPTLTEALAIGYLGVIVTAAAFVAWYSGVRRLGIARAGLFAGLTPISTVCCAILLGTSTLSPLRVVGATLVAIGVVAGLRASSTRQPQAAEDSIPTPPLQQQDVAHP